MIGNLYGIDNYLFVLLLVIIFFLLLLYASVVDLYYKRIPNFLTANIAVVGIIYNYLLFGNVGLLICFYGLSTGFFVTLFFFKYADLGAGDVKLYSAIGSLVGYKLILFIIAYSYIISAVLGIVYFKLWIPSQKNREAISSVSKPTTWLSQRIPMAPSISISALYVICSPPIAS